MANPSDNKSTENKPPFDDAARMRAAAGQNGNNGQNSHNADNVAKNMDQAAQNIDQAAQNIGQMGKATADKVGEFTQRAADRSRENVRQGVHAMAAAQAPLADMSYDNSRRFVETSATVTEVYRDASENTAEDVLALVGAYSNIGRGMQRYQHALLNETSRSMQTMSSKFQDLFRAKTPVAVAEIHRDLYFHGIKSMISGSTTLLHLMEKVTQEAVRPLHERESQKSQGKSL